MVENEINTECHTEIRSKGYNYSSPFVVYVCVCVCMYMCVCVGVCGGIFLIINDLNSYNYYLVVE